MADVKGKTIIVDSNYVAYSEKFALSAGLTYRGGRTEIIFGFIKTILNFARKFDTDKFIFCWDSKTSLRKEIYPQYKANRKIDLSSEEEESNKIAYAQFDKLKKVLPDMGFSNVFEEEGYESDDIIASLVIGSKDYPVVLSSDKDLYQLLNWCSLCNIRGEVYTKELFVRQYRINPSKWGKVKAIAGCDTDNVKGVAGVGEKTAIKYFKKELNQKTKTYDCIKNFDDKLTARLVCLPFEGCPEFRSKIKEDRINPDKFLEVFERYGFESLIKSLKKWESLF